VGIGPGRRDGRVKRVLLRCGAGAGPLFVTTFLVEGASRPGYDPLRHPVSSLSIGPGGWVQVTNFAATSALCLAGSAGLARARPVDGSLGPLLVGVVAIGLAGSGAFPTDPLSGYPPGTPDLPTERSAPGIAHDLFGVPVFLGLPAAALTYGRRFRRAGHRGWARYSTGTAVAMLVTFGASSAGFAQTPNVVRVGGLLQRASIVIGFGWLTALALHAARRP
jgi:hypothetical protein